MKTTNSSSDLLQSRQTTLVGSNQKYMRRASLNTTTQKQSTHLVNSRRPDLTAVGNDFLTQRSSSNFSAPRLVGVMNKFFQASQTMEEEIMLPSRLKDMPIEELVMDSSTQPENWHELYSFVREMRNQLKCTRPFLGEDEHLNTSNPTEVTRKYSNDDEGVILFSHDSQQDSSASSTASSEESEQSIVTASFTTIKDDMKQHYYGLLGCLDNLTGIANRVTEKYREESRF